MMMKLNMIVTSALYTLLFVLLSSSVTVAAQLRGTTAMKCSSLANGSPLIIAQHGCCKVLQMTEGPCAPPNIQNTTTTTIP
jgi:hypothetical protein